MLNKIGLIKVSIVQLVTIVLRHASDGCGRLPPFNFNSVPFNFKCPVNTTSRGALQAHVDGPDGRAVRCHLAVLAKGWRDRTVGRRRSGDSSRVSKGRIERREETHAHS